MKEVVTVEPTRPPESYTVIVENSPSAGGSVSGGGEYDEGASVTVSALANPDYEFVNWTEDGSIVSSDSNYTFNMGAEDRSLTAHFEPSPVYYTLTIETIPTEGGTVSGDGEYEEGELVTVSATPNDIYEFVNWTEDGSEVSTDTNFTFNMGAGNRTLTAHFDPFPVYYTLTLDADPAEGGSVTGDGEYEEGETVTASATPNENYEFANWTEDGSEVSTDTSYTFNMVVGDRSLTANFNPLPVYHKLTIEINPSNGGTVSGDGDYEEGETVTAIAAAYDNYVFVNWTENGDTVSSDAIYTFNMGSEDIMLTAHFDVLDAILPSSFNKAINLYPNPADATITIDGLKYVSAIKVINATGQIIATFDDVISGDQLDVSNLEKGIYMLRIESNGEINNVRLIK